MKINSSSCIIIHPPLSFTLTPIHRRRHEYHYSHFHHCIRLLYASSPPSSTLLNFVLYTKRGKIIIIFFHQSKKNSVNRSKVVKVWRIVHLLVQVNMEWNLLIIILIRWCWWRLWWWRSRMIIMMTRTIMIQERVEPCGNLCCIGRCCSSPVSGQIWNAASNWSWTGLIFSPECCCPKHIGNGWVHWRVVALVGQVRSKQLLANMRTCRGILVNLVIHPFWGSIFEFSWPYYLCGVSSTGSDPHPWTN